MPDEADVGNDKAEDMLQGRLDEYRRKAQVRETQPTGYCQNPRCEEELGDNRIYCDRACAEEHERLKRLKGQED